jgi:phosphate transport system substrate-binding protein
MALLGAAFAVAFAHAPVGASAQTTIAIDGSSTVFPITEAVAEEFQKRNRGVRVTVGISGTGGGFRKFCRGETAIQDASRPILKQEMEECARTGVRYMEIPVAFDALTVVANPQNTFARCLTVAELKRVWEPGAQGQVMNWNQVRQGFPDGRLTLYGAGSDSGTFDYFTEAVNGKEGRSRTDYQATEDDNVTVRGVSGSKGGMGYFGLSYLEENKGRIKGVAIDGGSGCVEASVKTVQDGTYKPLSRGLFIYPTKKLLERPEGLAFVEYYISNTTPITKQALYVDLTAEQKAKLKSQLEKLRAGS